MARDDWHGRHAAQQKAAEALAKMTESYNQVVQVGACVCVCACVRVYVCVCVCVRVLSGMMDGWMDGWMDVCVRVIGVVVCVYG